MRSLAAWWQLVRIMRSLAAWWQFVRIMRSLAAAMQLSADSTATPLRSHSIIYATSPNSRACMKVEAVTTLVDAERIARRVFGGTHPLLMNIEDHLRCARKVLRVRESPHT